ncbi:Dol-P-Man:Man(5)GlcNAc(2)-PP-Dol alpha-1,3-mannosyltransferase [Ophiocordyceps camponoti-floridani]|uniref:Dol-P-Man:Man(5)GlcNAc(2)-PP-Dol alpha-1,3-mannosyltransferase n=1 Tax=Ophiocordyceps camponoti-floridani TaxID=2030778 RepID=A0A8H4VFQ0_9HYPO|nr:Dol-P-Man:Man(5)GlcNAc(2)-PP-Dol alpha-1,3-mannosyltransferase [Ophiocordyceps camponoti-floridani]
MSSLQDKSLWRFTVDVAAGRHALSSIVAPALWLLDAVLCCLVIWGVPYTEIDWVAYMEQVAQFLSGERDYAKIEGGTGPLVYPAAHVYIYSGLYHLTNRGENILLAQKLFAGLYLATLGLVMLCYRRAKAPPYLLVLLVLSKRLHSVFMLRCFNDCFAVFFLWLAIFLLQRRLWTLGALAYSLGLGVKMSLLLVLPAVAVVLFLGRGFGRSLHTAWLMALLQLALAVPFLAADWKSYLGRAFELSRQFKFEWTVNWRMVGEDRFLSKSFAITLLALHAAVLMLFIATRWIKHTGRRLSTMIPALLRGRSPFTPPEELAVSRRVTPEYVITAVLSANVVGLLFARSLHYQFYAYLYWSSPYLLWIASPHPLLVVPAWLAQEWAWNVFPSTTASSSVVVGVLAVTVGSVYLTTAKVDDSEERIKLSASKNE